MFEALNRVLESIQFGPHERRVKIYLEETTTGSVDLPNVCLVWSRPSLTIFWDIYRFCSQRSPYQIGIETERSQGTMDTLRHLLRP